MSCLFYHTKRSLRLCASAGVNNTLVHNATLRLCASAGVLVLVLFSSFLFGCSRKDAPVYDDYIYAPVTNAFRQIELVENASLGTNRVTLVDLDVRGMSAADFKRKLESVEGAAVHVWMPGRTRWLIVSRPVTNAVSMSAAMEAIASDEECPSLASIFSNYVGTREEIMPAFASRLEGEVVPEWFVTKDIPTVQWLDGRDVDADIRDLTLSEIRSMQLVRREVLEGDMLAAAAKTKGDEEKATDKWNKAALRNPHDTLLNERLDRLARNAKGFLKVGKVLQAMKCYETMVLVKPTAASVHNFGMCLKKIGKSDLAEKVLKHAKELEK